MMKVPYTGSIPKWIPTDSDTEERENIFEFSKEIFGYKDRYCFVDHYGNQVGFKDQYEQECRKFDLAPGQPFRAVIYPPEGYRCSYEYDEWDTHYYIEYTHQAPWTDEQKKEAWNKWFLARRNYADRYLTVTRRIQYIQKNCPQHFTIYREHHNKYGENRHQKLTWWLRSSLVEVYNQSRFVDPYSYAYLNTICKWESPLSNGVFYEDYEVLELEQQAREYIKAWLIANTQIPYKKIMQFMKKPIKELS